MSRSRRTFMWAATTATLVITSALPAHAGSGVSRQPVTHERVSASRYSMDMPAVEPTGSLIKLGLVEKRALYVTITGNGSLQITGSPEPTYCNTLGTDTSCVYYLDLGSSVTLTATPSSDSRFDGWGGLCSGTGSCDVTMDQERVVTLTFVTQLTLGLSINGPGQLKVFFNGQNPRTCSEPRCQWLVDKGTAIGVQPVQATAPISDILGWAGDCTELASPCSFFLDRDRIVTATFGSRQTLHLAFGGKGTPTVLVWRTGSECGSGCAQWCIVATGCILGNFTYGTSLTLAAVAEPGTRFDGWGSDRCPQSNVCIVTMTESVSLSPVFELEEYVVTVSRRGKGSGTVTSPSGIKCGRSCTTSLPAGTSVKVTAKPARGSRFVGWGSDVCKKKDTCTVTLMQSLSLFPIFEPDEYRLTVSRAGKGEGTVTSPSGIQCGKSCSKLLPADMRVTLTARPAKGSRFAGWSGAGCAGRQPTCSVRLGESTNIAANFSRVKG